MLVCCDGDYKLITVLCTKPISNFSVRDYFKSYSAISVWNRKLFFLPSPEIIIPQIFLLVQNESFLALPLHTYSVKIDVE